jgi:hypothetical protein
MSENPNQTYQITKYNFTKSTKLEVLPQLVRGLANAENKVDELNQALSSEERDNGVEWSAEPSSRLRP